MEKSILFDRIVTTVLVLICIALAVVVVLRYLPRSDQSIAIPAMVASSNGSSKVRVSTSPAEIGTFIRTTSMGAELKSSLDTISLSSTVSGKVTSLKVVTGQQVQAGDVIATVDPSTAGSVYKSSNIVSALSGTIYSVDTYVGAQITTNTSLATLGQGGDLEVVAQISDRFLSTLKAGMKATFTTSAWGEETFGATVKSISPNVNATNRTVEVTLSLNAPDARLKEGMYVKLSLATEEIPNAIIIPTDAITTYLGEPVVYVVEDGKAKRVPITTSSSDDNRSVITSGLVGIEEIITVGTVVDGTVVNVIKESV